MDIAGILKRVDCEKLYSHVLKLEGTRHPIDTPGKLDDTADYIRSEFEEYGLEVNDQEFRVQGFDGRLRNIEGAIENGGDPELLIVSHYDTQRDCPGADDNASAVAIMLEASRVLAQEESIRNVRFVSFSLEELNPARVLKLRKIAQNLGLTDEYHRYTSAHTHKVMKRLWETIDSITREGRNPAEALSEARSQLQDQMSESETKYLREIEEMSKGITTGISLGEWAICLGSDFWVKEALRLKKEILGVVNLETVGYTSDKEHSQTLPKGIDPKMFQTHNVKDITVGDFLVVIGDANSGKLVQSFCTQSKLDSVDLPYACLQVPFGYEAIAQGMPDLLRSDHACFWREAIPGLFLTDSAEFRNPYYHTQADTIEKLDFDFMVKVCKATIATTIDLTTSLGR